MLLIFVALLAATTTANEATVRDCVRPKGMYTVHLAGECNLELGPWCPDMVERCTKRTATLALKFSIESAKGGSTLLSRYLALPQEWRHYASCVFERGTDIVHALSCIDAGCLAWDHVHLIKPFTEGLARAEAARA